MKSTGLSTADTMGHAATLAAIVIGVMVGAVYLQGGFYPTDAFGVAVLSLLLVVGALLKNRDGAVVAATITIGGMAAWWLIRAVTQNSAAAFLPLGASMLGFLAALLIVRSVNTHDRPRVCSAVVSIGALTAAAGLVGELWRWTPLAERTDGVWRISTTLTYPAAAAALFIISLLVAMSLDLRSRLVRASLCLCLAGLIGTQSRWDLLALGAGALVVPLKRWPAAAWPLAAGSLAGLVVVASRTGTRPAWWAVLVVAAAVGSSDRQTLELGYPRPIDGRHRRGGTSRRFHRLAGTARPRGTRPSSASRREPDTGLVSVVQPMALLGGERRRPAAGF